MPSIVYIVFYTAIYVYKLSISIYLISSGKIHSDVRARWNRGDADVVAAMKAASHISTSCFPSTQT